MLSVQRHQRILEYVTARKSVTVGELSDALSISPSTLRRDVQQLDDRGLLRRVHGGVVSLDDHLEPPMVRRAMENVEYKRRIGEAAARLVDDGDTIIITGGTTTEAMIPFLAPRSDLTVITNALNIVTRLLEHTHIAVVVLGGWLHHGESYLLGHLTEQSLQDLHAAKTFQGIHGLDAEHGLTGTSLQAIQTDRSIISRARELIIVADHSKFGRVGPVRMAPMEAVSVVVTDDEAPADMVQALRGQGVTVIGVTAFFPGESPLSAVSVSPETTRHHQGL